MKFKSSVKKQARVNARVRYIEGDMSELEYTNWKADNFDPADVMCCDVWTELDCEH